MKNLLIAFVLNLIFIGIAQAEALDLTPLVSSGDYSPSYTYTEAINVNKPVNKRDYYYTQTPVHTMPTGVKNTVLVHPAENPFATPTPAFVLRK